MVRTGHAASCMTTRRNSIFRIRWWLAGTWRYPSYARLTRRCYLCRSRFCPIAAAYFAFLRLNMILLALAFWLLRAKLTNLAAAWSLLPVFVFLGFLPSRTRAHAGAGLRSSSGFSCGCVACPLNAAAKLPPGALVAAGLFKLQIVIPIALIFSAVAALALCRRFRAFRAIAGADFHLDSWARADLAFSLRSMLSVGGVAGNQVIFPSAREHHGQFARVDLRAYEFLAFSRGNADSNLSRVGRSADRGGDLCPTKACPENRFILAITASVLVSYYLFIHDLSVMLIPIALVLNRYLGPPLPTTLSPASPPGLLLYCWLRPCVYS